MENVTEKIKRALLHNGNWKFSDFYSIIDLLKNTNINISFWENEENWATLISDSNVVGYLWKEHPLLIIEPCYLNNINLANYSFLNIITTPNLNAQNLKLDDNLLNDYLISNIDHDKFSANDLWFFTNSI
ncbi:hypothetical protein CHRYSEOSP005_29410 [Chryseobacterium sp. Alg-005]|uniref:hypothetical protein n=1 Tax=Chryseobacterium sp. Alg-005 TaxID=3159516 RepID=UPI0035557CDA